MKVNYDPTALDSLISAASRQRAAALEKVLDRALTEYEPTMNFTVHCYDWADPSDVREFSLDPGRYVAHYAYIVVPGGGCQIVNHAFGEEPPA